MIKVTSWEQVSHETVLLSLEVPYIAMKGVVAGRRVQFMAASMACGMIRTLIWLPTGYILYVCTCT